MPYAPRPEAVTYESACGALRALRAALAVTLADPTDADVDRWRSRAFAGGEVRPEHVFPDAIGAVRVARALLPVVGDTAAARAVVADMDAAIDAALARVSRDYGRVLVDDDDMGDILGASFTWTDDWTDYLPA